MSLGERWHTASQNVDMQLVCFAGEKWRSATLSLDGLLDYDESDKDEGTFELSLFAEAFQDMLMRDYGQQIYEAMQAFRYECVCKHASLMCDVTRCVHSVCVSSSFCINCINANYVNCKTC